MCCSLEKGIGYRDKMRVMPTLYNTGKFLIPSKEGKSGKNNISSSRDNRMYHSLIKTKISKVELPSGRGSIIEHGVLESVLVPQQA
jgi:hypothetical protein